MKTSRETNEFYKAFFSAQGDLMKGVKKEGKNRHFRSKYAKLSDVVDVAGPILQGNDLIFMQFPGFLNDAGQPVTTRLIHSKSGQWMETTICMPMTKRDAQMVGNVITYACRYSLMAMLGMPPVDDDGEGAMGRGDKPEKSANQARKDGDWPKLEQEMRACSTPDQLKKWGLANNERIGALPNGWQGNARDEYKRCMDALSVQHSQAPLEANGAAA